jgi:hypothetical protein
MQDFNDAHEQHAFDVIPAGTIVPVCLTVHRGGAGAAKDGKSEGLDCELAVLEGAHAKRRIWTRLTLAGTTQGHAEAAETSRATIRAILESARGIRPDDRSEQAAQARRTSSYGDLDGLRFLIKTGVQPESNGFRARNTVQEIITPERKQWQQIPQVPKRGEMHMAAAAPAKIERPAWAR